MGMDFIVCPSFPTPLLDVQSIQGYSIKTGTRHESKTVFDIDFVLGCRAAVLNPAHAVKHNARPSLFRNVQFGINLVQTVWTRRLHCDDI